MGGGASSQSNSNSNSNSISQNSSFPDPSTPCKVVDVEKNESEHHEVEVSDDVKGGTSTYYCNESLKKIQIDITEKEQNESTLALQVALDAELAEKIANEMMDEEYALKLAAEEEGIHSSTPALQHHVDIKLQQQNDEVYAKKMNDLFELEESDSDIFHNEIQRIRDLSLKAEINSKTNTEFKLLERARLAFQQQQQQEAEASAGLDPPSKKKKKTNREEPEPLSPTLLLTDLQKQFFQHYGFVVIQKVIHPDCITAAKEAAHALLSADVDLEISLDPNINNKTFANFPESHRPEWANCQDEHLRALFTDERNASLCRSLVGDFDFENHTGAGSYTFAPRFRAWDMYPPQSKHSKRGLAHGLRSVCPSESYDLNDLPMEFDCWSRQFLLSAQGLGMAFAPCAFPNWHVDGWDTMTIAGFDLIWGTFLSPLKRGNLGNLIVYPGSHYCISKLLHMKGARDSVWYDSKKGELPLPTLPSLCSAGVADGRPYEVLVKEGDVILMHPFLAHGVGTNVSLDPRLAVYCRLQSSQHAENRRKMHEGGDLLAARTWTGDIFSLQPGMSLV